MNGKTAKLLRKVNTYLDRNKKKQLFEEGYAEDKKEWKGMNKFEKGKKRIALLQVQSAQNGK